MPSMTADSLETGDSGDPSGTACDPAPVPAATPSTPAAASAAAPDPASALLGTPVQASGQAPVQAPGQASAQAADSQTGRKAWRSQYAKQLEEEERADWEAAERPVTKTAAPVSRRRSEDSVSFGEISQDYQLDYWPVYVCQSVYGLV